MECVNDWVHMNTSMTATASQDGRTVLIAEAMEGMLWVVTPCHSVKVHRHFRKTCPRSSLGIKSEKAAEHRSTLPKLYLHADFL
jgi:hypothetical protein